MHSDKSSLLPTTATGLAHQPTTPLLVGWLGYSTSAQQQPPLWPANRSIDPERSFGLAIHTHTHLYTQTGKAGVRFQGSLFRWSVCFFQNTPKKAAASCSRLQQATPRFFFFVPISINYLSSHGPTLVLLLQQRIHDGSLLRGAAAGGAALAVGVVRAWPHLIEEYLGTSRWVGKRGATRVPVSAGGWFSPSIRLIQPHR